MKNTTSLILSAIAVVAAAIALIFTFSNPKSGKAGDAVESAGAAAGDIVYIRLDTLMMQYDMYSDLQSAFDAKAQEVESDLNKKGRKLESDIKNFENQINKGLLTRSAAEQQQASLQQRQQDLQNLAAQKQMELQEESAVNLNVIMDAVKTYLENYNEEHKFAAIFTTTDAAQTIIVGDKALDITQEIVDGLNAEYIKNRNNNAE